MPRPWVKVHVEFLDNPKIMTLSLSLRGIWFTALAVAERYDKGGLLPPADRFALMAHCDDETTEKAFVALAKKGLLDLTDDGYSIHDWTVWQAVLESDTREAWRDRKARQREKERMSRNVTRDSVTVTRDAVTVTERHGDTVTRHDVTPIEGDKEGDRDREGEPILAPSARKSDPIWDALVEETGTQPSTKMERGMWNAAVKELRDAGATAEQVHTRSGEYRSRWTGVDLTPMALVKHWGALSQPSVANGKRELRSFVKVGRDETAQGFAEFNAMQDAEEAKDGTAHVQRGDGKTQRRLQPDA